MSDKCPKCGEKYNVWNAGTDKECYTEKHSQDGETCLKIQLSAARAIRLYREAGLPLNIVVENARLGAIVDAAWEVRREESDYQPSPDLALRAEARKKLRSLLDAWKKEANAAGAAKGKP